MKLCPYKFGYYEFEGGQECDGLKCGMFKRCANDANATHDDFYFRMADVLAKSGHEFKMREISADEARKITGWDEVPEAQQQDSREKLEEYIRWRFPVLEELVIECIDRQAAITERDLCRQCSWPSLAAMPDKEAYDRIAELKAKLDQMTVERDILQDCVDDLNADTSELQKQVDELTEQRDRWRSNWTERNIAYSELADECQELEAKVDELTAELERETLIACNTCAARIDLEQQVEELTSELAAARKAHAQAEHEAVILREKLGRMLDNAHEITRIGGDC